MEISSSQRRERINPFEKETLSQRFDPGVISVTYEEDTFEPNGKKIVDEFQNLKVDLYRISHGQYLESGATAKALVKSVAYPNDGKKNKIEVEAKSVHLDSDPETEDKIIIQGERNDCGKGEISEQVYVSYREKDGFLKKEVGTTQGSSRHSLGGGSFIRKDESKSYFLVIDKQDNSIVQKEQISHPTVYQFKNDCSIKFEPITKERYDEIYEDWQGRGILI